MIVPRPLHSIPLLSFLARRSTPASPGLSNFYRTRATSSSMASSMIHDGDKPGDKGISSIGSDTHTNHDGRIWIRRPFQIITPLSKPATTSGEPTEVITNCPLPKSTPKSSPKDKLHYIVSSSSTPQEVLKQIYQSKVELYESQFQSRVSKEAEARIQLRTIQSPHGLGEVDTTIYFPGKDDDDDDDDCTQQHQQRHHETTPPKLKGICLHVHGGGWLWGDSQNQVAHRCLEMADSMNVAVVSVEYSLFCQVNRHCIENNDNTNEFDPVNDVSIAIDWIESKGVEELNTHSSLVASGESSGAHLLILAMLNRRDGEKQSSSIKQYAKSSWKCLNLVYGVYDISGTPSIRTDGDSSSPLCGNDLLWMYKLYHSKVQCTKQVANNDSCNQNMSTMDRQHPSLSPLYANLSHMPPALVTVGTADPLQDDSLFFASKYSAYGNHVELAIYEGGEHGIGHFGLQEDEEMGVRARRHTLEFMKGHL